MILPGPEAQQLATYTGWLLHGTKGGLVAGICKLLDIMSENIKYIACILVQLQYELILSQLILVRKLSTPLFLNHNSEVSAWYFLKT